MFVSITADKKTVLQVKIVDAAGRIVSEEEKLIDKGNNVFPVNTSKLKKGNYILHIIWGTEKASNKFVIMN